MSCRSFTEVASFDFGVLLIKSRTTLASITSPIRLLVAFFVTSWAWIAAFYDTSTRSPSESLERLLPVALSLLIHLLDELFELRLLFFSQNRAYALAPLLSGFIELRLQRFPNALHL
jgi:hypothetical protein